jgi:ataxia telangiectasia mutated family protein
MLLLLFVDVYFVVYKLVSGSEERSYLSVEGQVNSLIQQARDPGRLCNLFVGWQPYI